MEENEKCSKTKENEEFEAERQDQMNINKYLQDLKEHEAKEVRIFETLFINVCFINTFVTSSFYKGFKNMFAVTEQERTIEAIFQRRYRREETIRSQV